MPVQKLTIQSAQNATPIDGKETIYRDSEVTGFSLKVTPSNSRIFFYQYRVGGRGGQTKKIKIGKFPEIKPDDARRIALQYVAEIARKEDPSNRLKVELKIRKDKQENTFGAAFELYTRQRLAQNRSGDEVERVFAKDFLPSLKDRPLAEVTRGEISKLISKIYDRNAPYAANRSCSFIKTFFRWSLGQGFIHGDPTSGLQKPFKGEASRERVLTPVELKLLWAEFGELGYPFSQAMKILLLTAQRRDEVGNMRWSAIDLENGIWSIDKQFTKNKQPHVVPLRQTVVDMLTAQKKDATDEDGQLSDLVFTTNGKTAVSGWSKIKQRINAGLAEKGHILPDWRIHDFRRTVSSALGDMGYHDQDIAMLLNHQNRGVTAIYNRSRYLTSKTKMLSKWESMLREITSNA
jgi:integrase